MKRLHPPSSSEDSDDGRKTRWKHYKTQHKEGRSLRSRDKQSSGRNHKWTFKDILSGNSTCWSERSKTQTRRGKGKKPSEVFRTDLITAMKVHDAHQLSQEDYYVLADPWRQEWEKGVQVPVSPQSIPQPVARVMLEKGKEVMFTKPKKLIRTSGSEALGYVDIRTLAEGMCRYDLNEQDMSWLELINEEFTELGLPSLDEITMEKVMEEFERRCHDGINHAVETEEGLGIEYDEDVVCDVCQSPDGEDSNEMVFCDKCNICVHQACYGIQKVPEGSWLCRICALGIVPTCQLCPKKGGAMKPTRSGTKWVHVSCALWIPEVSIRNPEKMEPITNVSQIPSNRWSLVCCLCKEKSGACIQCSAKDCRTAFHVTCGLQCGLEMNTVLTEADEVKFKSYCPKHSGLEGGETRDGLTGAAERHREQPEGEHGARDKKGRRRGRVREPACQSSPTSSSASSSSSAPPRASSQPGALSSRHQQEKRVNQRVLKLQALEEDFHRFVEPEEVAGRLKLPRDTVDFVYQYWKVKRKANFNQPLLTPKEEEEESLARREQEALLRRLELFTRLRQDLERMRNLTYMVTRREKIKRSLCRVQEQTFLQQLQLLDQESLTGNGVASKKSVEEMLSLSLVATHSSQARPPWGHGGQRAKRGGAGKPRGRRRSRVRNEGPCLPGSHGEGVGPSSTTSSSSTTYSTTSTSPSSFTTSTTTTTTSTTTSTTHLQQEGCKDSISLHKHSTVNVADAVSYTRIHSHGLNVRLHKLEISQLTNHTKLLLPELSKVTHHGKLDKPEVSQVTNHVRRIKPVVDQVSNSVELNKPEVNQETNHTKLNKTDVSQVANHTKLNKTEVIQVTNHSTQNQPGADQVTNHHRLRKPVVSQVTNHIKLRKPVVNQKNNSVELDKPEVNQETNHTKLNKTDVSQVANQTKLNKTEVNQVTNHSTQNQPGADQVTNHHRLRKPVVSQVTNHIKLRKPVVNQQNNSVELDKPEVNQVTNHTKLNKTEVKQVTNHTKLNKTEVKQVTNHSTQKKPGSDQVTNHVKLRKPVVNQMNNSAELNKTDVSQEVNPTKLNKTDVSQVTNHTKLNKTDVSQVTNHTKLNKTDVSQGTNHNKLNQIEVNQVTNHNKLNQTETNQVTNHNKLNQTEVNQVTNHVKHYKEESRKSLKKEASELNHRDDNGYTMVLTRRRRGNNLLEKEKEEEEEEERRKKKKKSAAVPRERSPFVSIRRLGSKVIEKQIGWLKGAQVTGTNDGSTDQGTPNSHPQAAVSAPTKPNGCLRRASASSTSNGGGAVTNGRSGSHLRSWGKFRIPKRSAGGKEQEVSEPPDRTAPLLPPPPQSPPPPPQRCKTPHRQPVTDGPVQPSYPRTRLRTGTESHGEAQRGPRRCHSHQLRGRTSALARRYGAQVIRRGVLAS